MHSLRGGRQNKEREGIVCWGQGTHGLCGTSGNMLASVLAYTPNPLLSYPMPIQYTNPPRILSYANTIHQPPYTPTLIPTPIHLLSYPNVPAANMPPHVETDKTDKAAAAGDGVRCQSGQWHIHRSKIGFGPSWDDWLLFLLPQIAILLQGVWEMAKF